MKKLFASLILSLSISGCSMLMPSIKTETHFYGYDRSMPTASFLAEVSAEANAAIASVLPDGTWRGYGSGNAWQYGETYPSGRYRFHTGVSVNDVRIWTPPQ